MSCINKDCDHEFYMLSVERLYHAFMSSAILKLSFPADSITFKVLKAAVSIVVLLHIYKNKKELKMLGLKREGEGVKEKASRDGWRPSHLRHFPKAGQDWWYGNQFHNRVLV